MIEEFKIGSFKVDGKKYLGDIKIIKGKVHYWSDRYRQTLREKDIIKLLESKPSVILIGSGCSGLLQVPEEVQHLMKKYRVPFLIQKTPEACKTYNSLVKESKNVAAIFHATG